MRSPSIVMKCAVLGTVLLAAAGCQGEKGTDTPNPNTPATVTASPPKTQPAGAIKDLHDATCTYAAGAWSFSGELTNAGKAKVTYTVMVAVAKTDGGTVLGSKQITRTLAPGESATVKADKFYKGSNKGVSCVPSATKAPA